MTDIAWVVNQPFEVSSYAECLYRDGIEIKYLGQVDIAISELVKRVQYPLVITDLDLSPGSNCQDTLIKKIIVEASGSERPPSWRFGLRLIDLIRSYNSVNKDTPLIVVTYYHPEKSFSFPQAKKICLTHGVDEYLFRERLRTEEFYTTVKKWMRE